MTNCDLKLELFRLLDVVVPVHPNDILRTTSSQFLTRVLYNMEPPFTVSLVMDAHVLFCSPQDAEEAFDLFERSDVELSYSTRLLNAWVTSGFAVFTRRTDMTKRYWAEVTKQMNGEELAGDDQHPMHRTTLRMREEGLKFRWLSNNWFFAMHGANEMGEFLGTANCYRTSVLVNGRVRFIHGGENQCVLMNGNNNQYTTKVRTVYNPGKCTETYRHSKLVMSQEEFQRAADPYAAPFFNWHLLDNEDPDSLFWYADK